MSKAARGQWTFIDLREPDRRPTPPGNLFPLIYSLSLSLLPNSNSSVIIALHLQPSRSDSCPPRSSLDMIQDLQPHTTSLSRTPTPDLPLPGSWVSKCSSQRWSLQRCHKLDAKHQRRAPLSDGVKVYIPVQRGRHFYLLLTVKIGFILARVTLVS